MNSAPTEIPRNARLNPRKAGSNFANGIFRFKLIANQSLVTDAGDRSTIGSQALVWDKPSGVGLCGNTYYSDITYQWSTTVNINVEVSIDATIAPDYGVWTPDGGFGGLDTIRLNPMRPTTTFAHEIGHALGFLHSITPSDLMCNEGCPNYEARDVQGWHIAKLLSFYGKYY